MQPLLLSNSTHFHHSVSLYPHFWLPLTYFPVYFLFLDLPALDTSYKWNHIVYVAFCVWLLSFSIVLRFMHTVAYVSA